MDFGKDIDLNELSDRINNLRNLEGKRSIFRLDTSR